MSKAKKMSVFSTIVLLFYAVSFVKSADTSLEEDVGSGRYTVEGRVFPPDPPFTPINWQAQTNLQVNGGEYLGFVKEDGSFTIHNVPSGSYIVDVVNPDFSYEQVRVEINSKGKFRARKVNLIQTSQIVQVPYPLRLKPITKTKYFQIREQWRITDFLYNPMILMMVLPLLLIMVLPKMMNDPETKKEMEQISSFTKFEMPEMSEIVTQYLNRGPQQQPQQQKKALKTSKKRQ